MTPEKLEELRRQSAADIQDRIDHPENYKPVDDRLKRKFGTHGMNEDGLPPEQERPPGT